MKGTTCEVPLVKGTTCEVPLVTRRSTSCSIKVDLKEQGIRACTGFMWLRIGTSGGLLWTR